VEDVRSYEKRYVKMLKGFLGEKKPFLRQKISMFQASLPQLPWQLYEAPDYLKKMFH
jgi:hypothetical protein